jgi:hypothetical protein
VIKDTMMLKKIESIIILYIALSRDV